MTIDAPSAAPNDPDFSQQYDMTASQVQACTASHQLAHGIQLACRLLMLTLGGMTQCCIRTQSCSKLSQYLICMIYPAGAADLASR